MKKPFKAFHRAAGTSLLFPLTTGLLVAARSSVYGDAAADGEKPRDLTGLPIEALFNTPVSIATRTPEKLSGTPAAVHVITGEDIRRTGATSIAEALRLVPGMEVGRVDSHTWAISSRGFNDVFANKLLVLMDGRSIYTPLFSGVFWDEKDTYLEDIERIEVIRGPGASVWGANAVNGVINIITKPARETQGGVMEGGFGTEERGFGALRYGGKIGETAFFRIYGKYFNRDDSAMPDGSDARDSWMQGQTGFRVDWNPEEHNALTLQGDVYVGRYYQSFGVPTPAPPFATTLLERPIRDGGGNILGRWVHTISETADFQVQTYYDRTQRHLTLIHEDRDTFDVDFQNHFHWNDRNKFTWGGGYRVTSDHIQNSPPAFPNLIFNPTQRKDNLFSAFFQNETSFLDEKIRLMVGSKFEHNDYTGFEVQPGARISYTPRERHTLWASVARAVRTPSRAEEDITLNQPGAPPGFAPLMGSPSIESEKLIAYELGYRTRPINKVSVDVATFYNTYDDLRSIEPPPGLPGVFGGDNKLEGETYGVETAVNYEVHKKVRLSAGYTFLQMQLHRKEGGGDVTTERGDEGKSPHHQAFVRASVDLPHNVEVDLIGRYVDTVPTFGIPSYVTMDIRVAWRPREDLELSIVGQNLLDNQHPEYQSSFVNSPSAEIERSVYGKIKWRF